MDLKDEAKNGGGADSDCMIVDDNLDSEDEPLCKLVG